MELTRENPIESFLKSGLRAWQRMAGPDSAPERFLKGHYKAIRSRIERKYIGENFMLFWSGSRQEKRVGIYLKGSCDLTAFYYSHSQIQEFLKGGYRICILRESNIADSRSDIILQSLSELPRKWTEPVIEKLKLLPDFFRPRLFEKTFTIPAMSGGEEFSKDVVILSIAPDVARVAYRHKEHGFLVDPGGWWFNRSMDTVLADLSVATWFRQNFESIGRIGVDEFQENFSRIIRLIKERTGAYILVFNIFTVDPGDLVHNYQFVKNSQSLRRREFNHALVELSRRLDFSIVDVDRITKMKGIGPQKDFGHLPVERFPAITEEAFRIMRDVGIFKS